MKQFFRLIFGAAILCGMMLSSSIAEEDLSYLERVVVEKGVDTVSITLPPEMITEGEVWKGSISPVMTGDGGEILLLTYSEYDDLLNSLRESLNEGILDMVEDESFEYVSIQANEEFTEYIITIDGEELSFAGIFGVFGLQIYSYFYSVFSGESVDTISFSIVNRNTGEVVSNFTNFDLMEESVQ